MPASTAPPDGALELSVVIPCLNEAQTIEVCIRRALDAMAAHGIRGEVVVSDNGSTDGSIEISPRRAPRDSTPSMRKLLALPRPPPTCAVRPERPRRDA